jgi:hypothetical protein
MKDANNNPLPGDAAYVAPETPITDTNPAPAQPVINETVATPVIDSTDEFVDTTDQPILPNPPNEVAPNANPTEVKSAEQLNAEQGNAPFIGELVVATEPLPGDKLKNSSPYREPVFGEYGYILKENDEGYVSPAENDPHADQPPLGSGLYTVQAADLNAHTELSEQGVQLHDQVAYDSLWVNKWSTGAHDATVRVPWPTPIGAEKAKGITFNG